MSWLGTSFCDFPNSAVNLPSSGLTQSLLARTIALNVSVWSADFDMSVWREAQQRILVGSLSPLSWSVFLRRLFSGCSVTHGTNWGRIGSTSLPLRWRKTFSSTASLITDANPSPSVKNSEAPKAGTGSGSPAGAQLTISRVTKLSSRLSCPSPAHGRGWENDREMDESMLPNKSNKSHSKTKQELKY